jgi:hypothetical protein
MKTLHYNIKYAALCDSSLIENDQNRQIGSHCSNDKNRTIRKFYAAISAQQIYYALLQTLHPVQHPHISSVIRLVLCRGDLLVSRVSETLTCRLQKLKFVQLNDKAVYDFPTDNQ